MSMAPDSIQILISIQPRRLDSRVAEIIRAVSETENLVLIRKAFGRMRESMESHLRDEARLLYEPALTSARLPHRHVPEGFLDAHKVVRSRLAEIAA